LPCRSSRTIPGSGRRAYGLCSGPAPLDDRHQRGELVTGRGRIQEDDRFFSPDAPGRQEDDLSAQPGLQLTPVARWRHGPGVTVSPAATASGGSRRRPIWRCGSGGVTAWPICQAPFLLAVPVTAALPFPARTWMRLACTSSALGIRICRTPSWAEASMASAFTWLGRVIDRRNAP